MTTTPINPIGTVQVLNCSVDVYSSTLAIQQSLALPDWYVQLPNYTFTPQLGHSGSRLIYTQKPENSKGTLELRNDQKVLNVQGPLSLLGTKNVLPYLAYHLIEFQLGCQGWVTWRATGVSHNGKGVLLIGRPGAGKTSLILELCKFYECRFIADSLTIVGLDREGGKIFGGSKWLQLRPGGIALYHPNLLETLPPPWRPGDKWQTVSVMTPEQLGLESENDTVPIVGVFYINLERDKTTMYTEPMQGRSAKLLLYEEMSRYIHGTALPIIGGEEYQFLHFFPSLDTPELYEKRICLMNWLLEERGITYISGNLVHLRDRIFQMLS